MLARLLALIALAAIVTGLLGCGGGSPIVANGSNSSADNSLLDPGNSAYYNNTGGNYNSGDSGSNSGAPPSPPSTGTGSGNSSGLTPPAPPV